MNSYLEKNLSDIGTVERGKGLQKSDFTDSGMPCIHYGQIFTYYGGFTNSTISFVSPETAKECSIVHHGDTILAITSENVQDLCKSTIWLGDEDIVTGGHSGIFRHNQNSKFLGYYFQSEYFNHQKAKYAKGTKVIEINPEDILNRIKIKLPDLETQQKIVQILDLSNDTINKLENRIVIEKQKLNALCQKLIYSKKPNKKLENVAKSVNGYAFKSSDYVENGKYTILTIANVQKGEVDLNNSSHLDAIPYDIRPWQKLEIGDIVISMTGNVGRVARIDKQNCLLNQRVGKIIPENINADYLYYLLSYVRFENRMRHQAQGGAQDNLSVKDINNFKLYVPDDNVQNEISNCLNCQNKTIKLLKKNLENAKQQYKYLLNHLISGDFDLTNIKLENGKEQQ